MDFPLSSLTQTPENLFQILSEIPNHMQPHSQTLIRKTLVISHIHLMASSIYERFFFNWCGTELSRGHLLNQTTSVHALKKETITNNCINLPILPEQASVVLFFEGVCVLLLHSLIGYGPFSGHRCQGNIAAIDQSDR